MARTLVTLSIILLFLAPIGPLGLSALSEMTGLTVTSGNYDFLESGVLIRAKAERKGIVWEIYGLWQLGRPVFLTMVEKGRRV